jgi:probable rRNA maturation factor
MNVFVANEQDLTVDEVRLSVLARHALASEQIDGEAELSLLLVTPSHIRRLNARFAGDDYPTDVLAFPMMEEDEDSMMLGDVVMCPQVARNHARKLGHSLDRELETLCVHGILHLLGYDHQGVEDGKRMDRRVEEVLASFTPERVR